MLKLERKGHALDALIILAQKGSIHIYYRGINDKGQPLYEVFSGTSKMGVPVITNATEQEMIKKLLGDSNATTTIKE